MQTAEQNASNPTSVPGFVDRRQASSSAPGVERRQFSSTHDNERPEVNELAEAIDQYKLQRRRRFVTVEELYDVFLSLGYTR